VSEPKPKSFEVSKRAVWEAWLRVRANRGAAGVDEQSIEEFERDLSGNLFKLWNRLSSGSYFPPPVRAVEIPKRDGSSRVLGVPTVADRVAQTVACGYLEPGVESVFHPDSYGYRPGRSALDAVGVCRERCWRQAWVLDLDLKSFFDSVPHDLVLKAVARHTDERWVLLYVERWLKAPLQHQDASLVARDRGTPQGSAISPLLANVFLHYAFDLWMAREYSVVQFERYCDDVIVHARSESEARQLRAAIAARLAECGLELNERKTRIVYCKSSVRRGSHEHVSFDFLGYTFRPRLSRKRSGDEFVGLSPGGFRRRAQAHRAGDPSLALARAFGHDPHRPGAIDQRDRAGVDQLLWALLPLRVGPAAHTDQRIPHSLGHAEIQTTAPPPRQGAQAPRRGLPTRTRPVRPLADRRATRRLDDGSRMTGDCHVRFYERRGVRLPPATHPITCVGPYRRFCLRRPGTSRAGSSSWGETRSALRHSRDDRVHPKPAIRRHLGSGIFGSLAHRQGRTWLRDLRETQRGSNGEETQTGSRYMSLTSSLVRVRSGGAMAKGPSTRGVGERAGRSALVPTANSRHK